MVAIQTRGRRRTPKGFTDQAVETKRFPIYADTTISFSIRDRFFFIPAESINLPKELTCMFFPFTIIGFHTSPGKSGEGAFLNSNPPVCLHIPLTTALTFPAPTLRSCRVASFILSYRTHGSVDLCLRPRTGRLCCGAWDFRFLLLA